LKAEEDTEHEVQLSPNQPTLLLFDADLKEGSMKLPAAGRFTVAEPGLRHVTLRPSGQVRAGERLPLTVCFADGAAPGCARFLLTVHASVGERQVEVFRHARPVESFQAEVVGLREENARLREENARLRKESARPMGLTGLHDADMMGANGIPGSNITNSISQPPKALVRAARVLSYRAPGRAGVRLVLANLDDKEWTPQGAVLVGPKGQELEARFVPRTFAPGETHPLFLEVEASDAQFVGPFVLKVWEEGRRAVTVGNVSFPELVAIPGR
jgi:uncharacterized protein (TIGR02268 family)